MTNTSLTRRRLLGMGFGSVATAALFSKPARSAASTQDVLNLMENGNFQNSFNRVYSFLDEMMDAYAQGSTLRLIQSYRDQQGLPLFEMSLNLPEARYPSADSAISFFDRVKTSLESIPGVESVSIADTFQRVAQGAFLMNSRTLTPAIRVDQ